MLKTAELIMTHQAHKKVMTVFQNYYSGKISSKQENNPVAYKIVGRKYPDDKLKVINGMVDVKKVLEESHKYKQL